MERKHVYQVISALLMVTLILVGWPFGVEEGQAGITRKIRQEINILNSYLGSPSGSYATSSSRINIDTTKYSDAQYYFEVVASTTSAVSSNIYLKNATTYATVATITFSNSNTYTRYRTPFTPTNGSDYVIVIGNEAVQKGAIAARVIVLQNSTTLSLTQTQIEIGNFETGKSNSSTDALTSPKYWYYDSAVWNGSPTAYAEVVYQNTQVSSSTLYTTATTSKANSTYIVSRGTSYTVVEAWGAGGGGHSGTGSTGGGGGGGGAYARSTTTLTVGTSHTIFLPKAGLTASTTANDDTRFDSTLVVADSGTGASTGTGGAGGTVANSTGDVEFAGGAGNNALGTNDTGGGGGGAAGHGGAGGGGAAGQTSQGGGGGGGNGGSTATTGTGGASTLGGAGGNGAVTGQTGFAGVNHVGGGGGGGGSFTTLEGGAGGYPGGGGGGSDKAISGNNGVGGAGQMKLTEVHGKVGFCLEEDNGSFTFTCKFMIADQVVSTSTPSRVRVSFTPTSGRNYRITASTTNAGATYSIYNAKIVIDQTSPTLLEPQYLLANTSLAAGTALQNFLSLWDPSEWNTTNVYLHEVNAADNSTAVVEVDTSAGAQVTGSSVSSPDNRGRSGAMTMPSGSNIDTKATTNPGNVYASRILVQVSFPASPSEGTAAAAKSFANFIGGRIQFLGGRILFR